METEEITKLVDGIYKNILEKFNPGARQMINAGKAYLKALHGAASASKMYTDAIIRLAKQSQQGTWGGSADIGSALTQIVEVYKEIQSQQLNILKAFYVDLLVPLETNLEKDTKVVQSEQKRFLQQHKQRSESYSKAASAMKKCRKKYKVGPKAGLAMEKEIKTMQVLEEEKSKLDNFCEQSLKNAMTQERRRYGFVLERQCSLVKHYLAYHTNSQTMYDEHLNDWLDVAKSRERLPEAVESMFAAKLRQVSFWLDDDNVNSPRIDDDRISLSSQLRKTKSMDASCLDVRAMMDISSPVLNYPLSRAKSDFNLNASSQSLNRVENDSSPKNNGSRPKSMAIVDNGWESQGPNLVQAIYAYLSSGENQLSFHEGDTIAVTGERNKGWQYGENLRTQCSGWFPLAYTEPVLDDSVFSDSPSSYRRKDSIGQSIISTHNRSDSVTVSKQNRFQSATLTRFGDSLPHRNMYPTRPRGDGRSNGYGNLSSPPSIPAPMAPRQYNGHVPPPTAFFPPPPPQNLPPPPGKIGHSINDKRLSIHGGTVTGVHGNASLHSSNDSGFSNDPPPAPEIDYSDDENSRPKEMIKDKKIKSAESMKSNVSMEGTLKSSYNNGGMNTNSRRNTGPSMRQSSSVGHLSAFENGYPNRSMSNERKNSIENGIFQDKKVKRSKSMWKFKKSSDDVLMGMSMWKHRSLVDLNSTDINEQRQQQHKNGGGTPMTNKKFAFTREIDIGSSNGFANDDDDNQTIINGSSTIQKRSHIGGNIQRHGHHQRLQQRFGGSNNHRRSASDDDENGSSSEAEDSESCIVVDDHLKNSPPAPQSLLPRTRLIKQQSQHITNKVPIHPPADDVFKESDVDVRFESSKLQTFKYINNNNNSKIKCVCNNQITENKH
ncbi:brain-specific angiogenesis inhibitor 1-associated protein 2-like protein 1 isoform X2 [Daktulosphaira vitifoliae]|uniref:brain-specific angiogenesis inhibitor 1-associated protein 2-like protein 1 isoform X2 n=1 Tax=Daktulosphaira vitifoliae TaxID=58002 RepID=UPI0021AA84A0|nr:brain-specific angiogenesis inhibitor 1-associated protein 2-like protein 1 isoform X2 [Daktulosphaira vitifoliae]